MGENLQVAAARWRPPAAGQAPVFHTVKKGETLSAIAKAYLGNANKYNAIFEANRPMLSDLRESGAIEQDADMVILLHREDVYDKESPRAGEADLIVAKHRNGPTRTIPVVFQGHYSRFVDLQR